MNAKRKQTKKEKKLNRMTPTWLQLLHFEGGEGEEVNWGAGVIRGLRFKVETNVDLSTGRCSCRRRGMGVKG